MLNLAPYVRSPYLRFWMLTAALSFPCWRRTLFYKAASPILKGVIYPRQLSNCSTMAEFSDEPLPATMACFKSGCLRRESLLSRLRRLDFARSNSPSPLR